MSCLFPPEITWTGPLANFVLLIILYPIFNNVINVAFFYPDTKYSSKPKFNLFP